MKRFVRIFTAVLILALFSGLGLGLYLLAQQTQQLQAQLDTGRRQSTDLQNQIDQRDLHIRQIQQQSDDLKSQVEALTKQLADAGLKPARAISPKNQATMDAIEQDVQALRGLTATQVVTRALLTPDELRQHVIDMQQKNYTAADADRDATTLAMLDLLQPGFKLYDFIVELYSEQIAGFYEPDTKQLYVIAEPGDLSVLEKITFAHEFDHALQDQHFDLARLGFTNDKSKAVKNADQQLAYQALVEGDATLLMQQWSQKKLTALDLLGATSGVPATPIFDSAPPVFREQVTFPYLSGLNFVSALSAAGGYGAINAAFARPPVSTEQILHPDHYPKDQPQPISLPPLTGTLPSGWQLMDQNTLGEFMLRQYLTGHLTRTSEIDLAVGGWGGDQYAVYASSDKARHALAIELTWDTPQDLDEFAAAYRDYAHNRFGQAATRTDSLGEWWVGSDVLCFAAGSDRTLIVLGPDEATVTAVMNALAQK